MPMIGTCGNPENNGCAKVANSAYGLDAGVTSHLIYGSEWDAALKFISSEKDVLDSTSWGNYSDNTARTSLSPNSPAKTGAHEDWKAKNVYDMAGNAWEWTMEYFPTYGVGVRVIRGASFYGIGANLPAAARDCDYPTGYGSSYGFRVVLCIK